MVGKTITKTVDLSDGYTLIKFDDGEIGLFKILVPDGLQADLLELMEGEPEKTSAKPDDKDSKPADDAYTWADLLELSYKELKTLCRENDLDTKPKDYDKDEVDDLREEIAKEIEVKIPDDDGKSDEGKNDDKYTWGDLTDMDYDELEDLCDEEKLDTDPDDFDENAEDEEKFRRAIAKELSIVPSKPRRK